MRCPRRGREHLGTGVGVAVDVADGWRVAVAATGVLVEDAVATGLFVAVADGGIVFPIVNVPPLPSHA